MIQNEVVLAGKFLTEALTTYETQLVETVWPEMWGYNGMYHEAISDLPFGTLKYTTARIDYTGRAVNYGGKATTLPLANFGINMDEYKCQVGVLAAEWTWQELRSEEAAQKNTFLPRTNVVQSYRNALEKGLREWMHIRTVFGDPTIGFTGFINNPYVEVINVTAGANGVTGTGATAATAYEWFRTELSNFRKNTRLTAEATAAIVDEDIRAALQRRFADNSNDGTPAQMLTNRAESPQLRKLTTVNEFGADIVRDVNGGNITSIGGVSIPATADLLMFMDSTVQNNIMRHYADIDTMPPFILDDGMTYRQIGLCATSEVIYAQPFRARLYILNKS
ncbi:MAG: DUF2184 domain-containing protein [Lyngbya sp. HA4199-MV5]|jgi:hypothetical protein|nr:DUF2184 domain-containing protein [Lyngbya sp. HA4199-MV5]